MAANPTPPPLSSTPILLFILLIIATTSAAVYDTAAFLEHETMLEQLRNHGYTLFTNAIATSDLQYHLLTTTNATASTPSFTLFAPKDSSLFALDMSCDADDYVTTLLYHVVVNRRHTFSDLQNLTSPFLDTLLPHYSVLIGKTQNVGVSFNDDASVFGVMVDGVRVSDPDLFVGSRIAVHGIDGILVTGLNMYHGSDGNGNGSDLLSPPAESPAFQWNIPEIGDLIPTPQLEWNNVPIAPTSPANIPAAAPSENFLGHTAGRMKSLEKKKRGKRHRKGQGRRRHDGRRNNHHHDDL